MWGIIFGALLSMGLGYRFGYSDAKIKYKKNPKKFQDKELPSVYFETPALYKETIPTAPPSEYFGKK